MENIKFEITEKDIREYLKIYGDDYKYREAMLIKHLKDNNKELTKEALEILLRKNNQLVLDKSRLDVDNCLNSFEKFSFFQNLDISGICHILIPAIRYYDWDRSSVTIGRLYSDLSIVAGELSVPMKQSWEVLESTLDDYRICGKVDVKKPLIHFKLGRDHSRRELISYETFYGEKVKEIRKIIRKGVNKYVQGVK